MGEKTVKCLGEVVLFHCKMKESVTDRYNYCPSKTSKFFSLRNVGTENILHFMNERDHIMSIL